MLPGQNLLMQPKARHSSPSSQARSNTFGTKTFEMASLIYWNRRDDKKSQNISHPERVRERRDIVNIPSRFWGNIFRCRGNIVISALFVRSDEHITPFNVQNTIQWKAHSTSTARRRGDVASRLSGSLHISVFIFIKSVVLVNAAARNVVGVWTHLHRPDGCPDAAATFQTKIGDQPQGYGSKYRWYCQQILQMARNWASTPPDAEIWLNLRTVTLSLRRQNEKIMQFYYINKCWQWKRYAKFHL